VIYRTQLFNPADMDNVKKVQAGYEVQPLSAFLGQPAPPAAPAVDWPKTEQPSVYPLGKGSWKPPALVPVRNLNTIDVKRFGDKSLENFIRTDTRYGHDGLFHGPRGLGMKQPASQLSAVDPDTLEVLDSIELPEPATAPRIVTKFHDRIAV
jgi:hypothetical protein